jgi:cytidylate kinase
MLNKITIAISGKSGCGNTTISKMVAKKLNLKFINYTFRKMAEEKGISFEELRLLAEESTAIDMELDKQQVHLAAEGNCVLGSRLAIWMIDRADLKVYLTAPPSVRARIVKMVLWTKKLQKQRTGIKKIVPGIKKYTQLILINTILQI